MEKVCIIKQPAGIGDILFCLKIPQVIQKETEYKKVIWPVSEQYHYLKDYIICDNIEFPVETEDFEYKDLYFNDSLYMIEEENFLFVPLHTSVYIQHKCLTHNDHRCHGHMKYDFCNLSYSDWTDYFNFKRNPERENKLIELLDIDINEPFNLINKNCGTYPNFIPTERISPTNGLKNVYMNFYEGFNLFDWIKVFENAVEIHTAECGVYYILEKMRLENVFIYSKFTSDWSPDREKYYPDTFCYMKEHCNPNWRYMD